MSQGRGGRYKRLNAGPKPSDGLSRQQQRDAEIAARTQSADRARLQAIAAKLRRRADGVQARG